MRQRVMIAMELSCHPALLIADEPTTALDVTIQAQILKLIREMKKEMGTSILLITHDLGIIAEMCDRVAVMYAGSIVELAGVGEIFESPKHPYTQGLWGAIPLIDQEKETLAVIPGTVPDLSRLPSAASFTPGAAIGSRPATACGRPCLKCRRATGRRVTCTEKPEAMDEPLLEVKALKKLFPVVRGWG